MVTDIAISRINQVCNARTYRALNAFLFNRRSLGGTTIIWRHLVSVDYCCGGLFGWYRFAFFVFLKAYSHYSKSMIKSQRLS